MKLNFSSTTFHALSLVAGLASAAIVNASTVLSQQPPMSSRSPLPPVLTGIELTLQQQAQFRQIMENMKPQFESILPRPQLTPEQKAQIEAGKPAQVSVTPPTKEQEAKLKQLQQVYQEKIKGILTPEQVQKFNSNLNDPKLNSPMPMFDKTKTK